MCYYRLYIIHYTLYIIHYALCIMHYALCIMHYALFIIQLSLRAEMMKKQIFHFFSSSFWPLEQTLSQQHSRSLSMGLCLCKLRTFSVDNALVFCIISPPSFSTRQKCSMLFLEESQFTTIYVSQPQLCFFVFQMI